MARLIVYIFDLIVLTIIGWIVGRIFQRLTGNSPAIPRHQRHVPRATTGPSLRGETARDPVCGMFVSTEVSQRLRRGDQTLHFCSRECMERYQSEARHS